jgi:hypothetical protein
VTVVMTVEALGISIIATRLDPKTRVDSIDAGEKQCVPRITCPSDRRCRRIVRVEVQAAFLGAESKQAVLQAEVPPRAQSLLRYL